MRFEIVERGVRRQGQAHAGAHRRARRRLPVRRGAGGGGPGERRSRGSSATAASTFDQWGLPGARRGHVPVLGCRDVFFGGDAALRAQEHHHRGGATATRRRCRSTACCTAKTSRARPAPIDEPDVAEDGHPRVELRQRRLSDDLRFKVPLGQGREGAGAASGSRSSWASTCRHRVQGGAALPQLRRADGVHRQRRASSATPASTSARWTASRFTANGDEADLRTRLSAPATNTDAGPATSGAPLKTGRVMVKDEDVCLHCGLCAERCPTGAWDMQKFLLQTPWPARLPRQQPAVKRAGAA